MFMPGTPTLKNIWNSKVLTSPTAISFTVFMLYHVILGTYYFHSNHSVAPGTKITFIQKTYA